jgi:hypothetical protein
MRLGSKNPGLSRVTISGAREVPGVVNRGPAALGRLDPSPSEYEGEEVPQELLLCSPAEADHSDSKREAQGKTSFVFGFSPAPYEFGG